TLRQLAQAPGIQLFSFAQADAYVRRFKFLNRMTLPAGYFDLGRNVLAQDVTLVGPTVELIARKGLHPALSDIVLEVAREVNGRQTLFARQHEFPAPLEHKFEISADASRYYKSGK